MNYMPAIAAVTFYSAALFLQWRTLHSASEALGSVDSNASTGRRTSTRPLALLLTLSALFTHAIATYWLLFNSAQTINLSLLVSSNSVAFFMVLMVGLASIRLPVSNLYLFLFPIAITPLFLILLLGPGETPISNISTALSTHILVSLAAYSILMLAACQSGLLALQEKNLKRRSFAWLNILPPLESMERLLIAMLWVGLALLTLAILTGFAFLDDMFAQSVVHHTVLTSISWLIYFIYLLGRYFFGWRGLTTVRWTLSAFALLLVGYLGSKFVLEYLLSQ